MKFIAALLVVVALTTAAPAQARVLRGHCQYHYALSYVLCVSAGLKWVTPR